MRRYCRCRRRGGCQSLRRHRQPRHTDISDGGAIACISLFTCTCRRMLDAAEELPFCSARMMRLASTLVCLLLSLMPHVGLIASRSLSLPPSRGAERSSASCVSRYRKGMESDAAGACKADHRSAGEGSSALIVRTFSRSRRNRSLHARRGRAPIETIGALPAVLRHCDLKACALTALVRRGSPCASCS